MPRWTRFTVGVLLAFGCNALALPVADGKERHAQLAYADGGSIWTVRADGSSRRRLTPPGTDTAPAWSRDGRWLSFVREAKAGQGIGEIRVMDAEGNHDRTAVAGTCWSPLWSPTTDEIAFLRYPEGKETRGFYLAFVDPEGRPTRKALRYQLGGAGLHSPWPSDLCSWSRDGTHLSVHIRGYQYGEIDEVTPQRDSLQRRVLYGPGDRRQAEDQVAYHGWAPDGSGRELLIASRDVDGPFELTVGKEDAAERTRIARLTLGALCASWAPDGSRIAFESGGKIYVTSVRRPNPRLVTTGTCPRWSPN